MFDSSEILRFNIFLEKAKNSLRWVLLVKRTTENTFPDLQKYISMHNMWTKVFLVLFSQNTMSVKGAAFSGLFSTEPGYTMEYLRVRNYDWKHMAGNYVPWILFCSKQHFLRYMLVKYSFTLLQSYILKFEHSGLFSWDLWRGSQAISNLYTVQCNSANTSNPFRGQSRSQDTIY